MSRVLLYGVPRLINLDIFPAILQYLQTSTWDDLSRLLLLEGGKAWGTQA